MAPLGNWPRINTGCKTQLEAHQNGENDKITTRLVQHECMVTMDWHGPTQTGQAFKCLRQQRCGVVHTITCLSCSVCVYVCIWNKR